MTDIHDKMIERVSKVAIIITMWNELASNLPDKSFMQLKYWEFTTEVKTSARLPFGFHIWTSAGRRRYYFTIFVKSCILVSSAKKQKS